MGLAHRYIISVYIVNVLFISYLQYHDVLENQRNIPVLVFACMHNFHEPHYHNNRNSHSQESEREIELEYQYHQVCVANI